jgi:hypothetical protein
MCSSWAVVGRTCRASMARQRPSGAGSNAAALIALDLRGQLDWTMAYHDGSFAPAKNGGDKVGPTWKGKGT